MIGLKTNKKGYGKQCKKKYFNNIYWITLCIVYDLLQNVMSNITDRRQASDWLTRHRVTEVYENPTEWTTRKTYDKSHRLIDESGNLLDLLEPK